MPRHVFYSFHYDRDVNRAMVVRKSDKTKESYGFIDSAAIEEFKKGGDDAIKRWINNQLFYTSVTAVLSGTLTYTRRWVKHEIMKSIEKGNGLVNIEIHNIKDMISEKPCEKGNNPFTYFYFRKSNNKVKILEFNIVKREWELILTLNNSDFKYNTNLNEGKFSDFIYTYDYVSQDGYNNLENWIEKAFYQANR